MNVAVAEETNFNADRDLNIRCNYDNFTKQEEKKLNIVYVYFCCIESFIRSWHIFIGFQKAMEMKPSLKV